MQRRTVQYSVPWTVEEENPCRSWWVSCVCDAFHGLKIDAVTFSTCHYVALRRAIWNIKISEHRKVNCSPYKVIKQSVDNSCKLTLVHAWTHTHAVMHMHTSWFSTTLPVDTRQLTINYKHISFSALSPGGFITVHGDSFGWTSHLHRFLESHVLRTESTTHTHIHPAVTQNSISSTHDRIMGSAEH